MESTARLLSYKAFGLHYLSEIPLPELPLKDDFELLDTVKITQAELEERWEQFPKQSSVIGVSDGEVMFIVKNVAIFSIREGQFIQFSPFASADVDCVRLYILGSCSGILLMQKKTLSLHGSAFVYQDKAYALVGRSGAGKSTLASYLINQGYSLISDDVVPIIFLNNQPLAVPGYPQQKLWQQSLDQLGLNATEYQPLFNRENKYAVPLHGNFHTTPLPLAGIFELSLTTGNTVTMESIPTLERFHMLFDHTYQSPMIDRLGIRDWHFNELARFVNKVPMYRLTRPLEGFSAPEQSSLILQAIHEHVKEKFE